jgi:endonuclease YncB( thermonuclease family)
VSMSRIFAVGFLLYLLAACAPASDDPVRFVDTPAVSTIAEPSSGGSSTSGLGADTTAAVVSDSSITTSSTAAIASTTSVTTTTGTPTGSTTPPTLIAGQMAVVASITDGDTIRVIVNGVEEPLRLIGINAPEGGECLASAATARISILVAGQTVRLESDISNRDQYDRLLRYVYIGDLFVNEILVREGLALAREYSPDTAFATVLGAAQILAEADGVGMWAADACGATASGEIRVGKIRYDADGNDNNNLNDEWVEITNIGATTIDLTGWGVKDESASHRYGFPGGFVLSAGATVRLHTGCGTDTDVLLYWCFTSSAIWNNSGDTVFILDPSGNIVDSKGY